MTEQQAYELAERIVIEYANRTGREDKYRPYVREAALKVLLDAEPVSSCVYYNPDCPICQRPSEAPKAGEYEAGFNAGKEGERKRVLGLFEADQDVRRGGCDGCDTNYSMLARIRSFISDVPYIEPEE